MIDYYLSPSIFDKQQEQEWGKERERVRESKSERDKSDCEWGSEREIRVIVCEEARVRARAAIRAKLRCD